jgi:hypothetical protein
MDSRMRVSACGHRDHWSDTSSEAAAGGNGMFFPTSTYSCPTQLVSAGRIVYACLSMAKSRRSKITLGGAGSSTQLAGDNVERLAGKHVPPPTD